METDLLARKWIRSAYRAKPSARARGSLPFSESTYLQQASCSSSLQVGWTDSRRFPESCEESPNLGICFYRLMLC